MLVDVGSLPRIADPLVANGFGGQIPALDNVFRKLAFLGLVLVVQYKNAEACLLALTTQLLLCLDDVLFQLLDGVLEGRSCVVDLINNENILANQVRHLEGGEVEPLCAGDFGTRLLDGVGAEGLIEGEADGLDGNVGRPRLLQERSEQEQSAATSTVGVDGDEHTPENARRDVTATANGDHELRLEVIQDALGRVLAQLVHLAALSVIPRAARRLWAKIKTGIGRGVTEETADSPGRKQDVSMYDASAGWGARGGRIWALQQHSQLHAPCSCSCSCGFMYA